MIRINLAKKQALAISGDPTSLSSILSGFTSSVEIGEAKSIIQHPAIKRALVACLLGFVMAYIQEFVMTDDLKRQDDAIQKLVQEGNKLQKEASKMKDLIDIKKNMDDDEKTISNKIVTMRQLINARNASSKILSFVSLSIPIDVWLKSMKVNDKTVVLLGSSFGFNQISDFMKSMKDSEQFSSVSLVKNEQSHDKETAYANFELSIARKQ